MKKMEQLYEGKAKKVFKTDDENLYIVDYKDDASAFNGLKKGQIAGKGVVNNKMSTLNYSPRRLNTSAYASSTLPISRLKRSLSSFS